MAKNMTLAEMAQTVLRKWEEYHPELFVDGAVAAQEAQHGAILPYPVVDDTGACENGACADCADDCTNYTAAVIPQGPAHPIGAATFEPEHYRHILPAFEPKHHDFTACQSGTWTQRHP